MLFHIHDTGLKAFIFSQSVQKASGQHAKKNKSWKQALRHTSVLVALPSCVRKLGYQKQMLCTA